MKRLRIAVFGDKALDIGQVLRPQFSVLRYFDASHIGLVGLTQYLLYHALANLRAVVVDKIDLLAFLYLVLNGQEAPLLVKGITKYGQTWALVDALHTADTLVVVDDRRRRSGSLADCSLRTAERAGVAGKTVEAIHLYKRLELHTLGSGQVGFVEDADWMLLRVDILA